MAVTTAPTARQIAAYKTLLGLAGLKPQEESILSGYGAASCKDLSAAQLAELIDHLQTLVPKREASPEMRKARSVVLTLLTDMGFKPQGTGWERVNEYLKQPRIAGKPLYDCSLDELKALAVKLRAILKKRRADLEAEERLAKNN